MRMVSLIFQSTIIAAVFAASIGRAETADEWGNAKELFEARRYAEAQAAFEKLHRNGSPNADVLMHLGKLAAKRQDRPRALEYFAAAMDLAPDRAELHFEYGAACALYAAAKGTSITAIRYAYKAREHLRKAIALEPANLTFRHGLIEFCLSAPSWIGGGVEEAHDHANEIAARDPAKGAFARATIQRVSGEHAAALDTLAKLIDSTPDNYFALFQFGRCAAESGERLTEALEHLKHCLTLPSPEKAAPHAEVWWNIATIEKRRDNRDKAIAALRRAVELAPDHRQISHHLENYLAEEA